MSKARLDRKVAVEVREHRELVVTRDRGVNLDLRVSKATQVLLESKDYLAQLVRLGSRVCLADLDHKDKGVTVGRVVCLAKMDHLVTPGPLDPRDHVVVAETTECQVNPDLLDLQVLQDHQDNQSPFRGCQVARKDPISRLMKVLPVTALSSVITSLWLPSNT